MGAVGSDAVFIDGTEFILNQLFGYQSAEAGRERGIRLRDAMQYQHAWDDTSTDDPGGGWANAWPLGTHVGPIGWQADPTQTQFYGDGAGIINLGANGGMKDLSQAYSGSGYWLNASDYLTAGNKLVPFYVTYLASWYGTINSGVLYADQTGMQNLGIDYNIYPYPAAIANQPVRACVHLSGDFALHLHYMVVAYSPSGLQWGGGDALILRPYLYHQNGTMYTYTGDDLTITTGGNFPDNTQKWFWHCHQVLNVSSLPAGFCTIGFYIQGSWTNAPQAISIFCMSRGQIARISTYAPTQGSLLLTKAQLGYGCKTVPNGVSNDYLAQGVNCFHLFPIYAT